VSAGSSTTARSSSDRRRIWAERRTPSADARTKTAARQWCDGCSSYRQSHRPVPPLPAARPRPIPGRRPNGRSCARYTAVCTYHWSSGGRPRTRSLYPGVRSRSPVSNGRPVAPFRRHRSRRWATPAPACGSSWPPLAPFHRGRSRYSQPAVACRAFPRAPFFGEVWIDFLAKPRFLGAPV
jgi:hypothetical protein